LQLRWAKEDADKEHPGRLPTLCARTLWSGGVVRIEQHPYGIWVFELRYSPSLDQAVMEQVNALTGIALPLDLPVDLAASLLRGDGIRLSEAGTYSDNPIHEALFRFALDTGELGPLHHLRTALQHAEPEYQAELVGLASRYGANVLLFEAALDERNPELTASLFSFLRPVEAP